MLLNNHQYFQIKGLTKLNKQSDDLSEDEDEMLSPRQRFKVRRKSTASLLTKPPSGIRRGSVSSNISSASDNEDIIDVNDDDDDEVFKLTVRAQSRRYSVVSQTRLGSEEKVELVNIPIVVVTAPQEAHTSTDTAGWEKEYDNFRFR